uniref:Uncharacterized protein n=1 Tax=Arundo donax TaxID=35708 RepID=A0A0A9AXM3_ARUDO
MIKSHRTRHNIKLQVCPEVYLLECNDF